MSAVSELATLQRSFSADKTVTHQSRSGDDSSGGAVILDFVAHVQSAEADLIEAEEREEQRQAKREFAGLLRAYFKKLLSADEYKFLAACIKANKSLAAAGRELGIKHAETAESILKKCKAREKDFFLLMSYSGYDCRRGCEFMSRLFDPSAAWRRARDKIQAQREAKREGRRQYYLAHREEALEYALQYKKEHREEVKQSKARYYKAHAAELAEKKRRYIATHREQINAQKRRYRATHKEKPKTEEQKARQLERVRLWKQRQKQNETAEEREKRLAIAREKYRQNSEKKLASCGKYREAHREEINERRRAQRAANLEERRARERELWEQHKNERNAKRRERRAKERAARESELQNELQGV